MERQYLDFSTYFPPLGSLAALKMTAYLAFVCLVGFATWRARKHRTKFRVLVSLCVVLVVRFCLFGNPVAWWAYNGLLDVGELGARQKQHIFNYEMLRFQRDITPRETDIVTVGSSQLMVLFGNRRRETPFRIEPYAMAGMLPFGYELHRRFIVKGIRPKAVLLYLSDFDLKVRPETEALQMTPFIEPAHLWRLYRRLGDERYPPSLHPDYGGGLETLFAHKILGDVLPEHKYAVIFKKLADKVMGKEFTEFDAPPAGTEEYLRWHVEYSKNEAATGDSDGEQYEGRRFDQVWGFLVDFIEYCNANDVRVIVVEGQINPLVYAAGMEDNQAELRERLTRLAGEREGVDYIPKSNFTPLSETDFVDATHIRHELCLVYSKQILDYIRDHKLIPETR